MKAPVQSAHMSSIPTSTALGIFPSPTPTRFPKRMDVHSLLPCSHFPFLEEDVRGVLGLRPSKTDFRHSGCCF